jgi:Flp pilus assembly protein TadD
MSIEGGYFENDSGESLQPEKSRQWRKVKKIVDSGELASIYDGETLEDMLQTLIEENDYIRALRVSEHLIALAPYNAEGWFKKGISLVNLGKYREAIIAFEKVAVLNPADTETLLHLGICYENLGNPAEALNAYNRAIELYPNDDEVHFCKAITLEHLDQYRDAEAAN